MSDLQIWKIVHEIRYPAASLLFDNRGKIASKWQWTSDLTEWRISNNQVAIYNKSNTFSLSAGFKNCSVVMELPDNYDSFCNQAVEFSSWVLEILQVNKIERIGLRFIQAAKRQHFKLTLTKMREQLINITDEDWEILGGFPEDLGLPLTLSIGEYSASFTLGTMKKDQFTNYFEASSIKDKIPPALLYLDIDMYKINPDFSRNSYHEQISDFLKSRSQNILEISNKFIDKYRGFK